MSRFTRFARSRVSSVTLITKESPSLRSNQLLHRQCRDYFVFYLIALHYAVLKIRAFHILHKQNQIFSNLLKNGKNNNFLKLTPIKYSSNKSSFVRNNNVNFPQNINKIMKIVLVSMPQSLKPNPSNFIFQQ